MIIKQTDTEETQIKNFKINKLNGAITLVQEVDYENKNYFELIVGAYVRGETELMTESKVRFILILKLKI